MNGAVWVVGTFDTKADELQFVAQCLREQGVQVRAADVATSGRVGGGRGEGGAPGVDFGASAIAGHHPAGEGAVFTGERATAVSAMAEALGNFLCGRDDVAGVITAGGSGAAALAAPAMQRLPIGLPKLIVTTLASGDVSPFVGSSDIATLYPVVDVSGLNTISRQVLANAAHAMAGMVRAWRPPPAETRPAIGLTMFGVTTPCVQGVTQALQDEFECLVFHATGTGGRSLEKLADDGRLRAMVDLTTTEIADLLCGGVLSAGEDRLGAAARRRLPYLGSCGALDMVNFWGRETVPAKFDDRLFHVHNAHVTLMRTTVEENRRIGTWIAERLNRMDGPVRFLIPEGGVSALDAPGRPFWSPEADAALFDALDADTRQSGLRRLVRVPAHINEPAFIAAVVASLRELIA